MITQQQAETIVKKYSPTTDVIVQKRDGQEGIYLTSENTISITSDWSIAGLLHEITHAILFLEDGRTGHDGVFADRFTKIVNDYMENNSKVSNSTGLKAENQRLKEQLKDYEKALEKYADEKNWGENVRGIYNFHYKENWEYLERPLAPVIYNGRSLARETLKKWEGK